MNNNDIQTLKALKTKLKETLPYKIMKVIESYDFFCEQSIPDDAKGFTAHHSACKSAVIHAETLLKLAKWTDDEETLSNHPSNLESLINDAAFELREEDDAELES